MDGKVVRAKDQKKFHLYTHVGVFPMCNRVGDMNKNNKKVKEVFWWVMQVLKLACRAMQLWDLFH